MLKTSLNSLVSLNSYTCLSTAGKPQVLLRTLTKALFYSSSPFSFPGAFDTDAQAHRKVLQKKKPQSTCREEVGGGGWMVQSTLT